MWTDQSSGSNLQVLFSNQEGDMFWSNLQISHLFNVHDPSYGAKDKYRYNDDGSEEPHFNWSTINDNRNYYDIANRRVLTIQTDRSGEELGMSFEYLNYNDIDLPNIVMNLRLFSNQFDSTPSTGVVLHNTYSNIDNWFGTILDGNDFNFEHHPELFGDPTDDYMYDTARTSIFSNVHIDYDLVVMGAPLTYLMIRSNTHMYSNEIADNYINIDREYVYNRGGTRHELVAALLEDDTIAHAKDIGKFHVDMLMSNNADMQPFDQFWNKISLSTGSIVNSNEIMYPSVEFAGLMASNIMSNELFRPYIRNDMKTYENVSNLFDTNTEDKNTFVNLKTLSNVLFNNPNIVESTLGDEHLINKGLLDGFLTEPSGEHIDIGTTKDHPAGNPVTGFTLFDLLTSQASTTKTVIDGSHADKFKLVNYQTLSNYIYGHLLMPFGETRGTEGWSNLVSANTSEIRRRVPRMDTVLDYLDHNNYLSNYNHRVKGDSDEPLNKLLEATPNHFLVGTHALSNFFFDSATSTYNIELYNDYGTQITGDSHVDLKDDGSPAKYFDHDLDKFKTGFGVLGFVVNTHKIREMVGGGADFWEDSFHKQYTMVKNRVPSMCEMSNYVNLNIETAFTERGGATHYTNYDTVTDAGKLVNITNLVGYFDYKQWNPSSHLYQNFVRGDYSISSTGLSNVTLNGLYAFFDKGFYAKQTGMITPPSSPGGGWNFPEHWVTDNFPNCYNTKLLTLRGLSNFVTKHGFTNGKPFLYDTNTNLGHSDFLNSSELQVPSMRVFSNVLHKLWNDSTDQDGELTLLSNSFQRSNSTNNNTEYTQLFADDESTNRLVTSLGLLNVLRGANSFYKTEIFNRLDSNLDGWANGDYQSYFSIPGSNFVTVHGLSNALRHNLVEIDFDTVDADYFNAGSTGDANFRVPSLYTMSNYVNSKIDAGVTDKIVRYTGGVSKISLVDPTDDSDFASLYFTSNMIFNMVPKIENVYFENGTFTDSVSDAFPKRRDTSASVSYTYDHVVPTVTYTSNMINTLMMSYLNTNFSVEQYDGVMNVSSNTLFLDGGGSTFYRNAGARFFFTGSNSGYGWGSNSGYGWGSNSGNGWGSNSGNGWGSNSGNTGNQNLRDMTNRVIIDGSFMNGEDVSDYFSGVPSGMSTAETLAQDSENTYASILSTKLLYEVMQNSDKLMHMGSIYRMMNDFYEIKRISTNNFNDLVTSKFYSDRMLINSADVNSDRSFITVGWNNKQPLNYQEDTIFEVNKDKTTMINGDLLLGKNKWMLSFDEDSLSIKKYDPSTQTYVEKHVFT